MVPSAVYDSYLDSLLAGQRMRCAQVVNSLLEKGTPIKTIYTDLFQWSLYRVGELWEQNRISVAKEHLATAITESLLSLVYTKVFSTPRLGQKAVVACVANEYHQLGGKIIADLMEMRGWDAYFLGANTPVKDLLGILDEKKPELLALSLAVFSHIGRLTQALDQVRHNFPDLPILVGGQAFRWGGGEVIGNWPDVTLISDLESLEHILGERFKA